LKYVKNLVNEYAKAMNIIIIGKDFNTQHLTLFESIFNNYYYCDEEEEVSNTFITEHKIDIIIVNTSLITNTIKKKIDFFRKQNPYLNAYILPSDTIDLTICKNIFSTYRFDGFIPIPYNHASIYIYFYRILKAITDLKYLNAYFEALEEESVYSEHKEVEVEVDLKDFTKYEEENQYKKQDIRFTQNDKISSTEFMATLDETIIDKTEIFLERINEFIGFIYDLEESSNTDEYQVIIAKLQSVIYETYQIIDSLLVFSVSARAFMTLYDFLTKLDMELFECQKSIFCTMLLEIANDLEKWIKTIFVNQSTDDIHYFDASFASNILEIENIFVEIEDNDDDLEFF